MKNTAADYRFPDQTGYVLSERGTSRGMRSWRRGAAREEIAAGGGITEEKKPSRHWEGMKVLGYMNLPEGMRGESSSIPGYGRGQAFPIM